jgi:hypothetical protein
MRMTRVGRVFAAILPLLLAGCALHDTRPRSEPRHSRARVPIRLHLAAGSEREGWQVLQDEYGRPVYIEPTPAFSDADVVDVRTLLSDERNIVILYFSWTAAERLERFTTDHIGSRLAVLVDNHLVVSPVIARPVTEGALALDVGLSREVALRIMRGYAVPTDGQP